MEALRKRISDVDANFLEEVIFKLGPESWSRKWARGKKKDKERGKQDNLLTSSIMEQQEMKQRGMPCSVT